MAAEHTPYLNLLRKRYGDDEQLRLAAGKVQSTLASEGWRIITDLLEQAHTDRERNLILSHAAMKNGQVPSQADYARVCAFLAGVMQPQVAAESFDLAVEAMRRANESPE